MAGMIAGVAHSPAAAVSLPRRQIGIRQQLRDATNETHQRLHGHAGFAAVQEGAISRTDYGNLIRRLYGFHRAFEVAAGLPAERSEWLALDLIALGDDGHLRASLPLCSAMPAYDSLERVLGALYVVEGSALGGRSLARGLDSILGTGVSAGRYFFEGRDEKTGTAWRAFLARLDDHQTTAASHDALIASAVETFLVFETWLDGWSAADVDRVPSTCCSWAHGKSP